MVIYWLYCPITARRARLRTRTVEALYILGYECKIRFAYQRIIASIHTYHHHYEDKHGGQMSDGIHTEAGTGSQTHGRATHCRQKQRHKRQQKLHHVQLESLTELQAILCEHLH